MQNPMKRMAQNVVKRMFSLADMDKWMDMAINGGYDTMAGVQINERNAMQISAYYACVKVLSETLAATPWKLYRHIPDGKEIAKDDSLYRILHDAPNPQMTAYIFKETLMGHLVTWGNAYAEIEYDNNLNVKYLWPLPPDRVKPFRDKDGSIKYEIRIQNGQKVILPSVKVFHIPGLGYDGLVGYSPLDMMRNSLGLAKATEDYGATFFKNGSSPSAVVTAPNSLTIEAKKNMGESIEDFLKGPKNQHRILPLDSGMTYQSIGIPPDQAQFLESRKFSVREIARWFNVPPHLIGDLEQATYSNIEQMALEFVGFTMLPWYNRWAQTANLNLIPDRYQSEMFSEFFVAGLIRGDLAARYSAYAVGITNGIITRNEARSFENLNKLPDEQNGDETLIPLNMVLAKDAGGTFKVGPQQPVKENQIELSEAQYRLLEYGKSPMVEQRSLALRQKTAQSFKPSFRAMAQKIVNQETKKVRAAADKYLTGDSVEAMTKWVKDYYDGYPDFVEKQAKPAMRSLAEATNVLAADEVNMEAGMTSELDKFLAEYLAVFGERYTGSSLGQLEKMLAESDEPHAAILQRMAEWDETRPDKVADNETNRLANAFALATWMIGGVTLFRWVANAGACPICQEMNGKVVGREESFVAEGDSVGDLTTRSNIFNPPLHQGCECGIVPD